MGSDRCLSAGTCWQGVIRCHCGDLAQWHGCPFRLSVSTVTRTAESSNSYSSTWPFNWTTVLVPVYIHREDGDIDPSASGAATTGFFSVWERRRDILLLLIFSVGENRACQYSWIHCTLSLSYRSGDFFQMISAAVKNRILFQLGNSLEMHKWPHVAF